MGPFAQTPPPPYYAVIFSTVRTDEDEAAYEEMAGRMAELAATQPGYLGIESARGADGLGITVSYWDSLEAVRNWGRHLEHRGAQKLGRARWYEAFRLRVCRVEEQRLFESPGGQGDSTWTGS